MEGYITLAQFRSAIYHTVGLPVGLTDVENSTCYSKESVPPNCAAPTPTAAH